MGTSGERSGAGDREVNPRDPDNYLEDDRDPYEQLSRGEREEYEFWSKEVDKKLNQPKPVKQEPEL